MTVADAQATGRWRRVAAAGAATAVVAVIVGVAATIRTVDEPSAVTMPDTVPATLPEPDPPTPSISAPDTASTTPVVQPETPPSTTGEPPAGGFEDAIDIPSGRLGVGDLDLFVAHVDGDLWLHPGMLGDDPGAPVRLADLDDPRDPVVEGPGPNTVEHVAGVFDGAVLYSDCCEPVSGNLIAATGPDSERIVWGLGSTPTFSADRTRLASANQVVLTVVDLETRTSSTRVLDEGGPNFVSVWDVEWAADGRSVVLLVSDDTDFSLRRFDAAPPFAADQPVPIGTAQDASRVTIAGRRSDGAIAVAVAGPVGASVRFFDPETFDERSPAFELPPGATAVQWCSDDLVLWVEGDELWFQSPTETPRSLGTGYAAAWCAA